MAKTKANRVKELRIKKLWSQARLAQKAGVSDGTINRVETGRHVPGDITQERIARALGVPREEAFPDQTEAAAV